MTNVLTDAREAVKTALEAADLFAFTTIPDVATPPFVWIAAAAPYVTREGATFRGAFAHLEVVGAVEAGVNEVQAESLDDLILTICAAIDDADSDVLVLGDVGQPGQVVLNGQSHLACAVSVTCEIRL